MLTVTPSESAVFAALRSFLLSVLPAGQAQYKGSIAGNVLTVASMLADSAPIALGDQVLGVDVAYGTYISEFGTGTGGAGTYTVSIAQTVGRPTRRDPRERRRSGPGARQSRARAGSAPTI